MHAPAQALARAEAPSPSTSTRATEPGPGSAASTRGPGSLVGGTRSAPPMGPPADGPRPAALSADTELTQVPIGAVQPGLQMKVPAPSDAELMRQRGGPVESIGATRPALELGSFGPDVQALQRALMAAGAHLVPDGMFGVETRDALVAFQRQAGLAATGEAGPDVWAAIDLHQGAASGGLEAPSLVPAGPGQAKADAGRGSAGRGSAGRGGSSGGAGAPGGGGSGPDLDADLDGSAGAGTATGESGGLSASGGPVRVTETGTGSGAVIEVRAELEGAPAGDGGEAETEDRRGGGGSGGPGAGGAGGAAGGAGGPAGGAGGAGGAAGGAGATGGAGAAGAGAAGAASGAAGAASGAAAGASGAAAGAAGAGAAGAAAGAAAAGAAAAGAAMASGGSSSGSGGGSAAGAGALATASGGSATESGGAAGAGASSETASGGSSSGSGGASSETASGGGASSASASGGASAGSGGASTSGGGASSATASGGSSAGSGGASASGAGASSATASGGSSAGGGGAAGAAGGGDREIPTGGPGAGAAPERTGDEGAPGADPATATGVEEALRAVEGDGAGRAMIPAEAMAGADALAAMAMAGLAPAPEEEAPEAEPPSGEEATPAPPIAATDPKFVTPPIGDGGAVPAEVEPIVADAATRSAGLIGSFMEGAEARAVQITDASAGVRERILAAAMAAKALVEGNRVAQKAAVIAQFQASRATIRGKATALSGKVDADFGALVAQLQGRNAAFCGSVDAAAAASRVKVAALAATQTTKIVILYASAAAQYLSAGEAAAGEAKALAEAQARSFTDGVPYKMDSLTDGRLTWRKAQARAKAARAVGEEYAKGLRAKAKEIAGKSFANLSNDLNGVTLAANNANDLINSQAKGLKDGANANLAAAVTAADAQKKALKKAVNEARASALGALEQEEAEHLGNIDKAANDALAGIDSQAEGMATAATGMLDAGASGIRTAAAQLQAQLSGAETPDPDMLAPALSEASAALGAQVDALMAKVNEGVSQGEAALLEGGGQIAAALGEAGTAAVGRGQGAVTAFDESLGTLRTALSGAVRGVRDGYAKGEAQLSAARDKAFAPIVDQISKLFSDFIGRMSKGAADNAAALKKGLVDAAKGDMMKAIHDEAKKAADAEQPAWKSVVAWVLIIAVIVVVAVFAGPLIIGACVGAAGALGAGAVAATIIGTAVGGAIVGALSSGVIQVITNFRDGKAWNEGLGTAVLMGAATGLLTGGFGGWLSSGARLAYTPLVKGLLQGAFDVILNTAVAAFKGELDWKNFGFIVLQSVAANSIGQSQRVKALSEGKQFALKFGADVTIEGTKQLATKGELSFNDMAMATVSSAANNSNSFGAVAKQQQGAYMTGQDFGAQAMTGLRNGVTGGDRPVTGGAPAGAEKGEISDLLNKGDVQGVSRLTGMDPVEVEILMLYKNENHNGQFKSLSEIDAIQPGLGTKLGEIDGGPFRPVLDAVNGGDKALIQKLTKLDSESVDILLLYRDQEPGGRFSTLSDLDQISAGLGKHLLQLEPGGPALPSASIQSAGEEKRTGADAVPLSDPSRWVGRNLGDPEQERREAGAFIDKDEQKALEAKVEAGPAAGAGS